MSTPKYRWLLDNAIYISLRLIRKYLFPDRFLSRYGNLVPFFKKNMNQVSPVPIVDLYQTYCKQSGVDTSGKIVLEIGTGETDSTGHELMARGSGKYWGFEPLSKLNRKLNEKHRMEVTQRYPHIKETKINQVERVTHLSALPAKSVDIVLSHCVLEHVCEMDLLIQELSRVLKNDGCMIHYVDYRDHFFNYPYHFLLFSEYVWSTLLDPGYLPRYRVNDHIVQFRAHGFEVDLLNRKTDPNGFQRIEQDIHPCFNGYDRDDLMTIFAALFVRFT